MTARTKTLSFLLFLLMLGALIAVYALNDTAGRVVFGVLAGFALRSAADRMAVAFTRPAPTADRTR